MKRVFVDFSRHTGVIKPMHAVNNGPLPETDVRGSGNACLFSDAYVPYVRNHDASFSSDYGGEHTVDVENILSVIVCELKLNLIITSI